MNGSDDRHQECMGDNPDCVGVVRVVSPVKVATSARVAIGLGFDLGPRISQLRNRLNLPLPEPHPPS